MSLALTVVISFLAGGIVTAFAIAKLGEHWANVGDKLGKAVDAYNSATSTLESRVLVSARRLRDLKAAPEDAEIEALEPLDRTPRTLQATELLPALPEEMLEARISSGEGKG